MLLRIVAIIFPVFAIIAAGYFYARRKQPDMSFANQLNMDIFVPALVLLRWPTRVLICQPIGRWRWGRSWWFLAPASWPGRWPG